MPPVAVAAAATPEACAAHHGTFLTRGRITGGCYWYTGTCDVRDHEMHTQFLDTNIHTLRPGTAPTPTPVIGALAPAPAAAPAPAPCPNMYTPGGSSGCCCCCCCCIWSCRLEGCGFCGTKGIPAPPFSDGARRVAAHAACGAYRWVDMCVCICMCKSIDWIGDTGKPWQSPPPTRSSPPLPACLSHEQHHSRAVDPSDQSKWAGLHPNPKTHTLACRMAGFEYARRLAMVAGLPLPSAVWGRVGCAC